MSNQINSLKDIHKVIMNERKLGGVVEVKTIRLRTGEIYHNAVITNIDFIGTSIYSIGIMTEDQENLIVNITEISLLHEPMHKRINELNNRGYKEYKTQKKLKFLKRLFEINQGSLNAIFLEEAKMIIEDIGIHAAKKEIDTNMIFPEEKKIYSIA